MKKYSLFFIIAIALSCNKICPTDELQASRQDYVGNFIRLDGIYYGKGRPYGNDNQFFLYRNGIRREGCSDPSEKAIPKKFACSNWADMVKAGKRDRSQWGIYWVRNDTIFVERWQSVSDCGHDVFTYTGKILNDTTLLIPQNRQDLLFDTFRFAKFSPKPDSTNSFIK
jgi:hypothetical protein